MTEQKIFEKLLKILEKSRSYFITPQSEKNIFQDEFYYTMIQALGWQQNPAAGAPVMKVLKECAEKLSFHKKAEFPLMISLTKAIVYSQAEGLAKELQWVREKAGRYSFYWKSTQEHWETLISRDKQNQMEAVFCNRFSRKRSGSDYVR